jgi:hypothetical protein
MRKAARLLFARNFLAFNFRSSALNHPVSLTMDALLSQLLCISNSTAQHKHAINQPAVATFNHLVYHGIMLQATMRQSEAKVSIAKANRE